MAQTVARQLIANAGLAKQCRVDSAGTHAHHAGERPDPRAEDVLLRRGYAPGRLRTRKVTAQDFQKFDLILAMDSSNLTELRRLCPPEHAGKLKLLMDFAQDAQETDIPDPYYGNIQGFERVLNLCETSVKGLVSHLQNPQTTNTRR